MDILKKWYLRTILLLFGSFLVFTASSQDFTKTLQAFTTSYADENTGEYSKAIEELKGVYDENSYEINLRLGWLTYSSGLFTESMAYYQKAISLKPYAIEPRLGYVLPAAALGNMDQVMTQYKKILESDPMNTLVNYRVGMIYYGKEDYETALKYFEKVVNLYPFDGDSLLMYAWTNFYLGKLREAKILFQQVLLNDPTSTSAKTGINLIK